ncbi:hypothetical protein MUP01_12250 [Candidatus Bathyarchaeota archaeon]|nr:hypothetical protein [Candidatus Bathyarchaeota archaeon]
MSLEEMENFRRNIRNCPKCNSAEGFWITSNSERSYIQCKHCAAILDILEFFPSHEESKGSKRSSIKLRL